MIDRTSRSKLVLGLRRYAAKIITNDDLQYLWSRSDNLAVNAVEAMAWRLYCDMSGHRAQGRHALTKEMRRAVARWVLFLRTDYEIT